MENLAREDIWASKQIYNNIASVQNARAVQCSRAVGSCTHTHCAKLVKVMNLAPERNLNTILE